MKNYHTDLKNCPFCGKDGEIKDVAKPFRHGWVGCKDCGVVIQWKYTPANAIAIWNRRSDG